MADHESPHYESAGILDWRPGRGHLVGSGCGAGSEHRHQPARALLDAGPGSGLEGPWEVAWGPDQQLWVTERRGRRVVRVNPADGSRSVAVTIPEVNQSVHAGRPARSGVSRRPAARHRQRLRLRGLHLRRCAGAGAREAHGDQTVPVRPGARARWSSRSTSSPVCRRTTDHVGGRLAFGPDRKLYLTIGDQGSNFGANRCNANHAQDLPTAAAVRAKDWSKYQGKILRVDLDGSIPADNPEIGGVRSHIFSYGHRNPLGLAFGPDGRLYESEHGPSSDDEVESDRGGPQLRLAERGRLQGRQGVRLRQLVGVEPDSRALAAARRRRRDSRLGADSRPNRRGTIRSSRRRCGRSSPWRPATTCGRSGAARSRRAASTCTRATAFRAGRTRCSCSA